LGDGGRGGDGMGSGQWPITVLPAGHSYRHSRVSGNPERYFLMMVLSTGNRGIPAYAGMTVGDGWKDGCRGGGIPAYAGMTVDICHCQLSPKTKLAISRGK